MKRLGILGLCIGLSGVICPAFAVEKCARENGIELSGTVNAPWTMQIQLTPKTIPLNEPFDAVVTICSKHTELPNRITVDATMPAHKHGMNYEPKTAQIGSHSYEVKNLVFHMPGIWRLEVTAYEKGKPHRFTYDVPLR